MLRAQKRQGGRSNKQRTRLLQKSRSAPPHLGAAGGGGTVFTATHRKTCPSNFKATLLRTALKASTRRAGSPVTTYKQTLVCRPKWKPALIRERLALDPKYTESINSKSRIKRAKTLRLHGMYICAYVHTPQGLLLSPANMGNKHNCFYLISSSGSIFTLVFKRLSITDFL